MREADHREADVRAHWREERKTWLRYVALSYLETQCYQSHGYIHGLRTPSWMIDMGCELREKLGITVEEVIEEAKKIQMERNADL